MIEPVNVPILLDVEEAEEYAAQIGSLITISEVYGGLPSGGNAGEILIKNSDEDYDAIWGNINFPTEVFYATYGVTTADEIKAAHQAGKTIFLNYNGRIYGLSRFNEGVLTSYEFTAILGRTSYSAYLENSVWSQSSKQLVPIETIGLLHDLNTTDKSSIVNAINEVEAGKLETEYFDFTWDGDHNPVPATGVTSTNIKSAVQAGKLVFARVLIGDMDYPIIFSLTGCYDTYIQFNAFESNIIFDELTCSIMPDGNSNLVDLWNARYSVLPAASNNTPQNLGVAAVGSSDAFARADHVHAMPSAIDVGAIAAPSSPSSGDVLTYSNNAWVAAAPSSGISDYSDLSNKPQINSVTLSGNKSLADLGITPDVFYATYGTTTSTEIEAAYQAGKAVYCIQELLPGEYYCFSLWYKYGSAFHQFVAAEGNVVHFAICDSDSWSELYTSCYSKPSSGIPKSDLASAVQTSLGKADTALQTAPVSSVNGQTGAVTVPEPFFVTYNTSDMTTWTCDKTFAQITAAIAAGTQVVLLGSVGGTPIAQGSDILLSTAGNVYYIEFWIRWGRNNWYRIEHNSNDYITMLNGSIDANDVGAIEAPASPNAWDVLYYDGNSWAQEGLGHILEHTNAELVEIIEQNGNYFVNKSFNEIYTLFSSARRAFFFITSGYTAEFFDICECDLATNTLVLRGPQYQYNTPVITLTPNPNDQGDTMIGTFSLIPTGDGKLDITQGSAHAGEFLVVGSDGDVTTMTLATWQGGNY